MGSERRFCSHAVSSFKTDFHGKSLRQRGIFYFGFPVTAAILPPPQLKPQNLCLCKWECPSGLESVSVVWLRGLSDVEPVEQWNGRSHQNKLLFVVLFRRSPVNVLLYKTLAYLLTQSHLPSASKLLSTSFFLCGRPACWHIWEAGAVPAFLGLSSHGVGTATQLGFFFLVSPGRQIPSTQS